MMTLQWAIAMHGGKCIRTRVTDRLQSYFALASSPARQWMQPCVTKVDSGYRQCDHTVKHLRGPVVVHQQTGVAVEAVTIKPPIKTAIQRFKKNDQNPDTNQRVGPSMGSQSKNRTFA